jgi:hypothetical protein
LIARLHAKSPDERFSSAAEVRDLLADYLTHLQQPLTAPLPAGLRDSFPLKRHKWWVVAAAGVSLVATAAVWQVLHRKDGPAAAANASASIELPAGLLPLEDVDRQMREIGAAIGGLEQFRADARAMPSGGVSVIDAELSGIEAEVQGLEATGF